MRIIDRLQIRKTIAVLGIVLLVFSLIPIMWVSIYNHPTGDDIFYGLEAHQAWEESGSVMQTLVAATKGVVSDYYRWQGTFVALLIMRLQPTVFGESWYILTPFIVVGLLLGGFLYALTKVAKYILPMDKWDIFAIWSVVSFVMIQWVHVVGEAFYWFNGAVYYSGFWGVMLFGIGIVIEWCNTQKKHYVPLLFCVAIMIGGSNYITLLLSLILLTITFLFLLWRKRGSGLVIGLSNIILLVCLVISAMAPGNEFRRASIYASLSVPAAIVASLSQGFAYIDAWASGWWLLGIVFLLPTMIHIIVRSKYSFAHPGIVVSFLYGIFCAMQCPTMYAEASTGPGRVLNVIWYGMVLFSYLAIFYILGWIYRKLRVDILTNKKAMLETWIFVVTIFLVVQCGIGLKNDSIKNMTTMKAVSDLTSGRAKAYDVEYRERLEVLKNSEDMDIVFSEYVHKPKTVYVGDYSSDVMQGSNVHLAKWYNKNSVRVEYGE